jgi:hypothetical protein
LRTLRLLGSDKALVKRFLHSICVRFHNRSDHQITRDHPI